MHVMSFSEAAEVAIDRDTLFQRLVEDAPATGEAWEPLPDRRGAVMHTGRLDKDGSQRHTTDTIISFDPTTIGTRVHMDVVMAFATAPGWALVLLRPMARRRLRRAFHAMLHSLQTGDLGALREERRRNARSGVNASAALLVFYLLVAATFVAFFALVSVVLAILTAAMFVVAAVFPMRRLIAARRRINSSPTPDDR